MPKKIVITSCTQCPHHSEQRDYTEDSFETVFKWYCSKSNAFVRRYVDWNNKKDYIPADCPLEEDGTEVCKPSANR